jgi:peroxin-5
LNLNKIPQLNHSNWTNEFPHMDVHLDNNSQSRFENSFTKMRVNNPEQIDQQQSNSWSVDFSSQNNMIMDRQQPHDINIGFQRIQNNQPFQPRQNVNENLCWSKAFEEVQEQQRLIINAPDCSTALSESAGLLLKTVQDSDNPKFKDSKFLDLMKQFRDGEAAIEGDKVVEQISKNKNVVQDQNERWSDEYTGPLNDWAHKNEFNSDTTGDKSFPHDWAAEFKDKMEINSADDPDTMWENLEKQWTQDQQAYSHGADARFSQYTFTSDNPYATFPQDFLSDVTKHKNLTESVLALEAAVKTDPTSDKWLELGRKQQENENDFAAISAFRKSLELNSGNLEALMSLSVSYTNENYASEAYDTLQLWIERHPKYANLAPIGVIPMSQKHQVISQAFTRAAVSSPGADLDENVQTALGILFNISTEYHKAVDCFRAALSKRPNDYELWNKLG